MQSEIQKTGRAAKGACVDDGLLYRYLEKLATRKERKRIERHLNSCETCFSDYAALVRNAHTRATAVEKAELASLPKLAPQEQVAKILNYVEKDRIASLEKLSEEELPASDATLRRQLASILISLAIWRKHRIMAWQLGLAVVAVLALTSGSYVGISYYRASTRIQQAENLLQQNYRVYIEDTPRLAGGYETKGIGFLMAGGDSTAPYLTQASALTAKTLESGWKSDQAKHLLGKILIINQDYAQADSVFNQIQVNAAKSAVLLNDRGVSYFGQENWERAAQYFESAIKSDSTLLEARYNLALAKARQGETAEALTILNDYLQHETNENWKNAAEEFQKKLKAEKP